MTTPTDSGRTADAGSVALPPPTVHRRALLRRGGAAMAVGAVGVTGLAAVEALTAGVAQAAPGGPLVLGATNSAGSAETTLSSTTAGATLALAAPTRGGAQLRLVGRAPSLVDPPEDVSDTIYPGDVLNVGPDLYFGSSYDGGNPVAALVYTSTNASQLVPLAPTRVVDTRTAAGRTRIRDAAGNLDTQGRLLDGKRIRVTFDDYLAGGSVLITLTAVLPLRNGFLTAWESFEQTTPPTASSVNFTVNQVISNTVLVGTGPTGEISIFARGTTHVVVDLTGVLVSNRDQVNWDAVQAPGSGRSQADRLARRARAGTLPRWYRGSFAR